MNDIGCTLFKMTLNAYDSSAVFVFEQNNATMYEFFSGKSAQWTDVCRIKAELKLIRL